MFRLLSSSIVRSFAVLSAAVATVAIAPAGRTGQLSDGTVFFESALTLEAATSSEDRIRIPRGRVTFRVAVPESAGEPLSALAIEQVSGFDRRWCFDLGRTRAARHDVEIDEPEDGDFTAIAIEAADYDRERDRLVVRLAEPVAPGQVLTLRLQLRYTPRTSGVYLWRVEALPMGDRVQSQTLGTARFHFYSRP